MTLFFLRSASVYVVCIWQLKVSRSPKMPLRGVLKYVFYNIFYDISLVFLCENTYFLQRQFAEDTLHSLKFVTFEKSSVFLNLLSASVEPT